MGLKEAKEVVEQHLAENPGTRHQFEAAIAKGRRGTFQQVTKFLIIFGIAVLLVMWLSG